MGLFLPKTASRLALKAARQAQDERRGIIKALSHGKVSRRDLIKMGLFTGAGMLAPIRGLHPLQTNLLAQTPGGPGIPTGLPPSPLFGATAFSQPMPRFDVLPRRPIDCNAPLGSPMMPLGYVPMKEANEIDRYNCDPLLGGGTGPVEGRPGGPMWAHQMWDRFPPQVAVEVTQRGNKGPNTTYNPQISQSQINLMGIAPSQSLDLRFHPGLPVQDENSVWTFNGSIPPKLLIGRYGEPILMRHHNGLPADVTKNNGFGRHTISTHEHNGHHGAENDGFTGAFFFPGQFYDYHYPILLAGFTSMNTGATDRFASSPTDAGGLTLVPGDWHETMSTHWFHDHMFSFTSQNVYKGNAGMFNIYSGLDRGAEDINDGVNLRLPSGQASKTGKSWGNLDYDVNLMLAEKAFDANGQLAMDILQFDGFIGDVMTVNLAYKPFMNVERRKYRFRILNASVSRFFKLALASASGAAQPIYQIANDGNLLPRAIKLTELDEQGIAERFDIVIDFSKYALGTKLHFVNCCEHQDGKLPAKDLSVAQALSGASADPCVGRFMEFRVVANTAPGYPDKSFVPGFQETYPPTSVVPMSQWPTSPMLIPNPDLSQLPVVNERTFEFNRGANQTSLNKDTSFTGPWGISVNGMGTLAANYGRISAAPKPGTREIWHLNNGGGGWDHPIHIHFEEGQILDRDGLYSNVPLWERGRKDVYRLRPAGSLTITMQFRDFAGTYMEHCHNTVHEDNAMLVRWDINGELQPLPSPIPTPQGVRLIDADEIEPGA
jgi:FtsP/CotA-like multicopper oxidase with cupredoxin domain